MGRTKNLVMTALFAALIAVGAFIKIPIPLVPFTLQFLFTTLAGMLLKAKWGALSVAVYIAFGLVGFPVFAGGGGISYVLQPTFGYLIGFAVGAYITGAVSSRGEATFGRLLLASFAGLFVVYALGMIYYYIIYTFYIGSAVSFKALFIYCFALAVPGDALLCFAGALIGKRLLPILKKERI